MKDTPRYDQQYCKKHDQRYADFLTKCPICRGEELYEVISKEDKTNDREPSTK